MFKCVHLNGSCASAARRTIAACASPSHLNRVASCLLRASWLLLMAPRSDGRLGLAVATRRKPSTLPSSSSPSCRHRVAAARQNGALKITNKPKYIKQNEKIGGSQYNMISIAQPAPSSSGGATTARPLVLAVCPNVVFDIELYLL